MTYGDAERYASHYMTRENERIVEMVKIFSIANAESSAIGEVVANSKKGMSILSKYQRDVLKRSDGDDEKIEYKEYLERQFQ